MALAQRIEKRRLLRAGGLESLVDTVAYVLLFFGILVSCTALLSMSLLGVVVFLLGCFGAFVQYLLFRCIAELIRLQKKIAGIEYSGTIPAAIANSSFILRLDAMPAGPKFHLTPDKLDMTHFTKSCTYCSTIDLSGCGLGSPSFSARLPSIAVAQPSTIP